MAFPGFMDELRARVSLSDVVGRRSPQAAVGAVCRPLPVPQREDARFTVNDKKGFFHCFAAASMAMWSVS